MIIQFNGFPGVGKFTVARLVTDALDAKLLDNHLLVNLTYVASSHGDETYRRFLTDLQTLVYGYIEGAPKENIYVLTNALVNEVEEDVMRYSMVEKLSSARGDMFVPILLYCDRLKHLERARSDDRKKHHKLSDSEVLAGYLKNYTMIHTESPYSLEIDTSDIGPAQVAAIVIQHVKALLAL